MHRTLAAFLAVVSVFSICATDVRAEGAYVGGYSQNPWRYWYGIATNRATKAEAIAAAQGYCLERGSHCTHIKAFTKTCIAVAAGACSGFWYQFGATLEEAKQNAIAYCNSRSRTGPCCVYELGGCDTAMSEEERTAAAEEARHKRAREAEEAAEEAEERAAEAKRLEREARKAREQEEHKLRQLRAAKKKEQEAQHTAFAGDRTACQKYDVAACDRALLSPIATEEDRGNLNWWRAGALVAAASKPVLPTDAPDQGRRVALVVANSNYQHASKLANPRKDAVDIAAALRRVGFARVVEKLDVKLQDFVAELRRFEELAADADWAVVYFAGHGMEIDGVNYLIPVDAKLERANDVDDETLALDRVLSRIKPARRLKLIILDACRSNPFVSRMQGLGKATRAIGRGLARIEPQPGVLVAFAARDGQLALDGDGANSPYASAIIAHIDEANLEIGKFFRKVRDTVLATTGGAQHPFEYGSLPAKDYYFKAGVR